MNTGFWFNRLIEYWTLPTADQVVDHVRRLRALPQVRTDWLDEIEVLAGGGLGRGGAGPPGRAG